MFDNIISFFNRHRSFILTTHESPDADGFGTELVLSLILKKAGKKVRIINSSPVPQNIQFMIKDNEIEKWDWQIHSSLLENSALLVVDTSEENHLGQIREALKKVKETFIIDHHEPNPASRLKGFVDSTASSTSQLAIELACTMGVDLDPHTATAAYAGIVYDSGFFAYPKTTIRTFKAAIKTLEWGADPYHIYKQLMENSSGSAILLQKQALSHLEFHEEKKIALLLLYKEDFEKAGAEYEETENIVNIPLKAKEVEISLLLKEKENAEIFCSLRSKGMINVSKIAQEFGGGGHVTASGFRSSLSMEETVKKLLACVKSRLTAGIE
jgi:phosphoesterase RecJ-like protein